MRNQHRNREIRELAGRIRRSDEEAFERLFRLCYSRLVRFSMRYTRSKPAACDVVQEVFVKCWELRRNLDPEQSLMSYLYSAVRNRSLNWTEKKANRTEPIDEAGLEGAGFWNEEEKETDGLKKKFDEWISRLPDRREEAFRLSRFDGLDHEEIAQVMGLSEKTVNNHIVAALRELRDRYREYQQQNGEYYE